jgi:hypothetical protein
LRAGDRELRRGQGAELIPEHVHVAQPQAVEEITKRARDVRDGCA